MIRVSTAVIDAGPLVAAADASNKQHRECLKVLSSPTIRPVLASMAVAEATYLLEKHLGAQAEVRFLKSLTDWEVEAPHPEDWARMAELVTQYADRGLGGTDASVVALAERLGAATIVTLDRRHFSVVRPSHVDAFELLPN